MLVDYAKQVPDDDVGSIIELMEKVIKNERLTIPEDLELETYVSPNFMGFFLGQDSAKAIKALTATFVKELASRGKHSNSLGIVKQSSSVVTSWFLISS